MIWRIKPVVNGLSDKEKRTVLFAAKELKKYLEQVFDEEMFISLTESLGSNGIYLGINLSEQLQSVEDGSWLDSQYIWSAGNME